MAVKSGQILHVADGFVIDRAQNIGPAQISVDEEKIYEVGNFEAVGTVRGNADLTFSVESLDVTCEIEALLCGKDPTTVATAGGNSGVTTGSGTEFQLTESVPLNIISPFKSTGSTFTVAGGVILPYLSLESATYSFGVEDNATQNFSLRGDTMVWVNGSPYSETFTVTAGANQVYTLAETALLYEEGDDDIFVVGVTALNTTNYTFKRLNIGDDFTNNSTTFTVLEDISSDYDELRVVYGTAAQQTWAQSTNADTTVKPAAVRGRDIDVYLASPTATQTFTRVRSVQSADINWSVTLEQDFEFGNSRAVTADYDVPDVNGSFTIRSRDVAELIKYIKDTTGVTNDMIGPHESATLPMEIRVSHPETGVRLKTFYIPDAEFLPPGSQAQTQSKLETQFNWNGNNLYIYDGER